MVKPKKNNRLINMIALLIVILLVVAIIYIFTQVGWDVFKNLEELKEYLLGYGAFTPIAVFILQILQVIIAPIPGNITGLVSGALFGAGYGFLINSIAIIIGSLVVFWLARRYGKKLIYKLADEKTVDKYEEKISGKAGKATLFILFLLPFFPDDILCLLAGLTNIPFGLFILFVVVARLPGSLVTALVGAGASQSEFIKIGIIIVAYALAIALIYKYKDRLIARINKKIKK